MLFLGEPAIDADLEAMDHVKEAGKELELPGAEVYLHTPAGFGMS